MSDEPKYTAEPSDSINKDSDEQGAAVVESFSELALIREQLKIKEEEANNNYERYIRQTAEIENFKKRALRDKEDAIRYANEILVKELLPVVDNLNGQSRMPKARARADRSLKVWK